MTPYEKLRNLMLIFDAESLLANAERVGKTLGIDINNRWSAQLRQAIDDLRMDIELRERRDGELN